jgi:predicted MPP superfamily phosphohydrolase
MLTKLARTSLLGFAALVLAATAHGQTVARQRWTDDTATVRVAGLAEPVVVLHLSDAHLSVRDPAEKSYWEYAARMDDAYGKPRAHYRTQALPVARFNELLGLAKQPKADLLALTGDIINNPSPSSVRYVVQAVWRAGTRSLFVSGNHDWHYEGLPGTDDELRQTWTERSLLPLYEQRNPLASAIQVKGVNFVALDNSTYQVSPEQLAYFNAELARGLPVVLLVHIPIWTAGNDEPHVSLCGDPRWGWDADRNYQIERRERWSKTGNRQSTLEFVARVKTAPNLVAVLAGHTHRNAEVRLSDSAMQYVTRAACDGGYRRVTFEPRITRGPDAPGPDCVAEGLTLENFSGQLDDWYYPAEEPRERAGAVMPRLTRVDGDRATLSEGNASQTITVGQPVGPWRLVATIPGPEPTAVLEREFDRWGLIVYVAPKGPVAEIRKAVGRLEKIARPQIRFPTDYFDRLVAAQEDVLGEKILAGHREPSYGQLAGCLAPLETYTFLGTPASAEKFIVYPEGSLGVDLNRSRKPLAESLVFDPAQVAPQLEPTQVKRGLLGGDLPAIDYGFFDPAKQHGYELWAFANPAGKGALVRLRPTTGPARYWRTPALAPINAAEFYAGLLKLRKDWDRFFAAGMRLEIADRRALDVARGCIARAVSGLPGDHPKYGMGSYWGKPDHHDGFPPTTLSICTCLLDWGLLDEAQRRLGYYFDRFVKPDGTVRYYGPAVAEYGQFLDLAVACARRTGDHAWFAARRPAVERMADYLVSLLAKARQQPADALTFGLIQGAAEADTFNDQRYYFSGNAWCWRGLLELGRFYAEQGRASGDAAMTAAGRRWLGEAQQLQANLARAVARSVIRSAAFVPPVAGQQDVFQRMTESRLASYTNYRYWLETLSARCLTRDEERMILDYHQSHGGELLATIRFSGHLDDWPYYHHAWGMLDHDRVDRYLLGYWAHVAHHQTQGTFTAYEQVPIRGWRTRREVADYCVPAEVTAPLMTRWMLVSEERDADVLWLGRAIPRSWLTRTVAIERAATRWGPVGFRLQPAADGRQVKAEIQLPPQARPSVVLRFRHPARKPLAECRVIGARCEQLDAAGELVRLRPQSDRIHVTLLYGP